MTAMYPDTPVLSGTDMPIAVAHACPRMLKINPYLIEKGGFGLLFFLSFSGVSLNTEHFKYPCLFLVASIFFYPLLYPGIIFPMEYQSLLILFAPGTLSLLAVVLCFTDSKKILMLFRCNILLTVLIGVVAGGCFLHYWLIPNYKFDYILSSLIWISVPCFVALNHRAFEKTIPYFLALLAFLNLIQSSKEALSNTLLYGIAGNWNWNGALIVISTPFLMLIIIKLCRYFKLNPLAAKWLNIIIAVLSIYYIFLCDSKGVWVALFVAALVFYCVQGRNRLLRRMLLWSAVAGLAGTLIFLYLGGSSMVGAFMLRDVRMQLWAGTLALIRDNLFLGVGQPLFESAYASYNPVEYYLSFFATDRNPDPHNHLLLFLASNGIVVSVAWLTLLFLPFGKLFLNLKRAGNLRMKLYFFTALFLFFHGLLDMTLVAWPMNIVFLMMAGIFWGRYWAVPACMEKSVSVTKTVRWAALLCCAVLISALAVQLYRDAFSSYYFRKTRIGMDLKATREALADCDKSIRIKPTPENIYQAALLAFYDLKNPALCCSYLSQLEKLTAFKNYVNNNGLMAKALYLQGRKQESLQYFRQEAKNYPLSSANWYFYSVTLKELRLEDEAKQAYDNLAWSLEIKGLRPEHIPLLIKNPRWDMHFREVPGVNIKD